MKRAVLIFILILLLLPLYAAEEKRVSLNVDIPEDYNVFIPEGSAKLDRLVLELKNDALSELSSGTDLAIDDSVFDNGSLGLSLLYYGNLSYEYRVRVSVNARDGWIIGKNRFLPISSEIIRSSECDEDISVYENIDGTADIVIPSSGPRNGVPAADILLSWDRIRTIIPGRYSAEIILSLEAM